MDQKKKRKKKYGTSKWSRARPEALTTKPPLSMDQQPSWAVTQPAVIEPFAVLKTAAISALPLFNCNHAAGQINIKTISNRLNFVY